MKKSNILYISLISLGFLLLMIGTISIMAFAFYNSLFLFVFGFSSMGLGGFLYVVCIIIYLIRRRRK